MESRLPRIATRACLAAVAFLAAGMIHAAQRYGYPITDPYAATIVGTPPALRADLPARIPAKRRSLVIHPERDVPGALSQFQKLGYTFVPQDDPAPLIFLIAGTGGLHDSATMITLQHAFHGAGFHVVALSSPTMPEFQVAASTSSVTGHLPADAVDLHRVMVAIRDRLDDEITIEAVHLAGFSLGAAQAAFVARHDDDQGQPLGLQRVLMINPPVDIYDTVVRLDALLTENLPNGADSLPAFLEGAVAKLKRIYSTAERIRFDEDFLFEAYRRYQLDPATVETVVGLVFRLALANMLFTADAMTDAGLIVAPDKPLRATTPLTPYFQVAYRLSFETYFRELLLPWHQRRSPELTRETLIRRNSLRYIGDYLRENERIGAVTNADDFILTTEDRAFLQRTLGERLRIYPRGGHGGNLAHRENIRYMISFFRR